MLNLATNELLVTTFNSSLLTFPNVQNNVVMLHQKVSQMFFNIQKKCNGTKGKQMKNMN
jgi:hypothetical protein